MATIIERYEQKFSKSVEWQRRQNAVQVGGANQQTSAPAPPTPYIEWAEGPFKYDVDGNQIIDYIMGSGSLLMGHSPPAVAEAMADQARRGTHMGGPTPHRVRYAEAVRELMPNLERVQFTSSGTDSSFLAIRLARGYTGKTKVVKFHEHFHGWNDFVSPESGQTLGGILPSSLDSVVVAPVDAARLDRILSEDNDVAAVIVESNGAHFGSFPLQNPQFLQDVRDVTARHSVVFIMDEVITGFRLSPGGAQVRWDLEPDLTTMAKIVAGGQPGGAVGGKMEIMEMLASSGDKEKDKLSRVAHGSTYDAQPVAIAAGLATLDAIAHEDVNARADALALRLKEGLNEAFIRNEVTGHAHGISSIVHVNLGAECSCDRELCTMPYADIYRTMPDEKIEALRRALLVNGVDLLLGRAFFLSSAHNEDLVDRTVESFSQALRDLREEGVV